MPYSITIKYLSGPTSTTDLIQNVIDHHLDDRVLGVHYTLNGKRVETIFPLVTKHVLRVDIIAGQEDG